MEYGVQLGILSIVLLLLTSSVLCLFLKFKIQRAFLFFGMMPLLLFTGGFALRLSGEQSLTDLGFYFTEVTYVFLYLLFALALLFGQIKYWRVQR